MLDRILESCEYVMYNSEHVKINYNKLDLFIEKIDCKELKHWLIDNPYDLLELGISNIVNFLLIFESIDYSFWGQPRWTVDTDLGNKDGSDALLYVLLKYVKKTKSVNFSNMSLKEFKEVLKGNVEIPLLKDRYDTLIEVSNIVNNKMDGDFYEYTKEVTVDTELFQIIIDNFPSFRDEREYEGKTIYFYKLAQLLTSDILHLRELLEGVTVDYSHLLGCADYRIPQTMRALGIIEYDEKLSKTIDYVKP